MADTHFKHMNTQELEALMSDNKPVLVDIRDATSFHNAHIPGSIHLTNETVADFLREADPDVATVVVCYHGNSSQQAAQYLISQDFTDVHSLDGGFSQWQMLFPHLVE